MAPPQKKCAHNTGECIAPLINLTSSRPKTALFGNLGVDLRISLCGVQEYVSAQILDLLDLARKSLIFASGTAQFPPEFLDGNQQVHPEK